MENIQHYDLFVIGGGSGGIRAARLAAAAGLRVVVADPSPLGGTCVNLGCIPKKLYAYAAQYREAFNHAAGYGITASGVQFDWSALKEARAAEVRRLNGLYAESLRTCGASLTSSSATLLGGNLVEAGGTVYSAERILVATGCRPFVPPSIDRDLVNTSDEMFDLPEFPRRLLVVGAGYIGCEFASIFQSLGAEVTLAYRSPALLRGFDHDAAAFVHAQLELKGIELLPEHELASVSRRGGGYLARFANGDVTDTDVVLLATGRAPNVSGFGIADLGVELTDNGYIKVDDRFQTSVPGLYAVGDVVGRKQLTPVALAEARVLVDNIIGSPDLQVDYDYVPTAVFTSPALASVGLSEASARARHQHVRVYRSNFRSLRHTLTRSHERTFIKLIVSAHDDRVVGVHMVSDEAGEIVQGFAAAVASGITKSELDRAVGIHPTVAEEFVSLRSAD